ncbi:MAG: hypothetical protein FJ218_03865 [Ignavibacteria bacterium]|nr:hypothetical protein [Ignavibacteria bacterium]
MKFTFRPDSRLIVVNVHLFGEHKEEIVGRFALDTGATYSLINVHRAVLLGYDPAASEKRVQITTGSGIEFAAQITVKEVTALGQTRTNFPILCHTLPPSALVDGLLGLDFFRDTILNIDFVNGVITLNS